MERIRTTALSVSMILIMIGITLLPGAMGAVDFTANITSTQNTALEAGNPAFGNIVAGETDVALTVFTLNNTGNTAATVTAAFTSNVSTTYGFINTTYVISGTNFSLKEHGGTYTALLATSSGQGMTDDVPANTAETWDAQLAVPAGQTAAMYTGTVEITFS